MTVKITDITVKDIRFPTSRELDGSDAMNPDPDYSAAYVILHTGVDGLEGHGMTFTIGRGNELCVAAINALKPLVIGRTLDRITGEMGRFWRLMTGDSQLRWVGPEKGVIHLASAAMLNAVWDLWAKSEGKPLWKLVVDMSPEQLVACIDFSYITDVMTEDEALEILHRNRHTKTDREAEMTAQGYPAYTTAAGWLGYSDEKLKRLTRGAINEGWNCIKLKVGQNLEDDIRRLGIVREEIGPDRKLMIDANQVWEVNQAIEWVNRLAEFEPWWIEEPTSPDDILGHAEIRKAVYPVRVATGEHCHNRIMFKQFFQSGAIDICQLDSCRLASVNEILAVMLMAAKYAIPVCPHAGGVGLCEYVQHLSIIDYIVISATLEDRMVEYMGSLHEHFIDPCVIKNGRYMTPQSPGFSITMLPDSLRRYEFPSGEAWQES